MKSGNPISSVDKVQIFFHKAFKMLNILQSGFCNMHSIIAYEQTTHKMYYKRAYLTQKHTFCCFLIMNACWIIHQFMYIVHIMHTISIVRDVVKHWIFLYNNDFCIPITFNNLNKACFWIRNVLFQLKYAWTYWKQSVYYLWQPCFKFIKIFKYYQLPSLLVPL